MALELTIYSSLNECNPQHLLRHSVPVSQLSQDTWFLVYEAKCFDALGPSLGSPSCRCRLYMVPISVYHFSLAFGSMIVVWVL